MKILRLYFVFSLGLLANGFAQTSPTAQDKETNVTLHFIAATSVPASLRLKEGDVYHELELSTASFIDVTMPRANRTLELYTESQDAKGKTVYKPYASASLPAGKDDVVALVAAPERGGAEAGHLVLFPDSKQLHPQHSMRVINGSKGKVAMRVGKAQVALAPGEAMVAPYDPNQDNILLGLAVPTAKDAWRLVYSTNVAPVRNHRAFAVLRSLSRSEIAQLQLDTEAASVPEITMLYDRTTITPPPQPLPPPLASAAASAKPKVEFDPTQTQQTPPKNETPKP